VIVDEVRCEGAGREHRRDTPFGSPLTRPRAAFPRGLAELGYREGQDISIEWRSPEGREERLPTLAAELVRLGVDIVLAAGPEARIAVMKATSTVPIAWPVG